MYENIFFTIKKERVLPMVNLLSFIFYPFVYFGKKIKYLGQDDADNYSKKNKPIFLRKMEERRACLTFYILLFITVLVFDVFHNTAFCLVVLAASIAYLIRSLMDVSNLKPSNAYYERDLYSMHCFAITLIVMAFVFSLQIIMTFNPQPPKPKPVVTEQSKSEATPQVYVIKVEEHWGKIKSIIHVDHSTFVKLGGYDRGPSRKEKNYKIGRPNAGYLVLSDTGYKFLLGENEAYSCTDGDEIIFRVSIHEKQYTDQEIEIKGANDTSRGHFILWNLLEYGTLVSRTENKI